jgi:hypothetical protein
MPPLNRTDKETLIPFGGMAPQDQITIKEKPRLATVICRLRQAARLAAI